MKEKFEMVKQFILEMDMEIISEDIEEELVVVNDEENGIKNLIIDCEEPIVVLEQIIMKVPSDLQVNTSLILYLQLMVLLYHQQTEI